MSEDAGAGSGGSAPSSVPLIRLRGIGRIYGAGAARVVALIAVQFLATAAESQVARDAARWPLIYVSPLVGALILWMLLGR